MEWSSTQDGVYKEAAHPTVVPRECNTDTRRCCCCSASSSPRYRRHPKIFRHFQRVPSDYRHRPLAECPSPHSVSALATTTTAMKRRRGTMAVRRTFFSPRRSVRLLVTVYDDGRTTAMAKMEMAVTMTTMRMAVKQQMEDGGTMTAAPFRPSRRFLFRTRAPRPSRRRKRRRWRYKGR